MTARDLQAFARVIVAARCYYQQYHIHPKDCAEVQAKFQENLSMLEIEQFFSEIGFARTFFNDCADLVDSRTVIVDAMEARR